MPSLFPKPSKKSATTRRALNKKKSKLPLKLIAPVLAMVITLMGVGAATMLAQKSQENRGSASGCTAGATSCSGSTGLLWECDGNSFQEKSGPVICNQEVYDARYGNSNTNPDGTCRMGYIRCEEGQEQYCGQDGKWVKYSSNMPCGGVKQPVEGEKCSPGFVCKDGHYSVCQCDYYSTGGSGNCSWQREEFHDYTCTSDYYEWGAGGGQGGASQSSNQTPIGWMDSASGGTISGWAADPDAKSTSIKVHFYMDGPAGSSKAQFLGEATPSIVRPDILAGLGLSDSSAKHGYAFTIPSHFLDGAKHTVFAYGIDTSGVASANALLEPVAGKEIVFNRQPVGHIDSITGRVVSGWAADPDALFESIDVHFYMDAPAGQGGTFIGGVTTTIQRDDVNAFLGADSAGRTHGYAFTIPTEFLDGKEHTIYAHGIDLSGDSMANALLYPPTGMKATLTNTTPRAKILGIF